MGRKPDPQHIQDVVDHWRDLLVEAPWRPTGGAADVGLLAQLLGLDTRRLAGEGRSRLKAAGKALRLALADLPGEGRSSPRPDRLDGWIRDSLVDPGPRLLIGEDRRRAELARQRDAARRHRHAGRGLRSVRIEMHGAAWQKVEAVRLRMKARGGKATLQAALEEIIEHYQRQSGCARKPSSPEAPGSDLFS